MDEHNWATNKTECQTTTNNTAKYGQARTSTTRKSTKTNQV